jgi:hypothetical protein
MDDKKRKILILVEGEKTDLRLMQHLFCIYNMDVSYQIVSYNTNIYVLYNEMFVDDNPYDFDLLQVLKTYEKNPNRKYIFDDIYSDILLIFDLDPQDKAFSPDKIKKMVGYFNESSDMGKLYLNYPMVESFYHMKSIPDEEFNNYCVTLEELRNHEYKRRVNEENRNHNYKKFAVDKKECDIVIRQNIKKALTMTGNGLIDNLLPEQAEILSTQLCLIKEERTVLILSTCGFFIFEYNPAFING